MLTHTRQMAVIASNKVCRKKQNLHFKSIIIHSNFFFKKILSSYIRDNYVKFKNFTFEIRYNS